MHRPAGSAGYYKAKKTLVEDIFAAESPVGSRRGGKLIPETEEWRTVERGRLEAAAAGKKINLGDFMRNSVDGIRGSRSLVPNFRWGKSGGEKDTLTAGYRRDIARICALEGEGERVEWRATSSVNLSPLIRPMENLSISGEVDAVPKYPKRGSYVGNPPTSNRTLSAYITHSPLITPNTDFCKSLDCIVPYPHPLGRFLARGHVPRTYNDRWGLSDPPHQIWEAWTRMNHGTASETDEVIVHAFVSNHFWDGPEAANAAEERALGRMV